jgi:hypothetical protein
MRGATGRRYKVGDALRLGRSLRRGKENKQYPCLWRTVGDIVSLASRIVMNEG